MHHVLLPFPLMNGKHSGQRSVCHFFREFGSFFRTVTQSQCSKHITFGSNTYTGTASLSTLLYKSLSHNIRSVCFTSSLSGSASIFSMMRSILLQFQIDDIVHNAFTQRYCVLEQFKVKVCIRFEGVCHIRIKIDSQQTAGSHTGAREFHHMDWWKRCDIPGLHNNRVRISFNMVSQQQYTRFCRFPCIVNNLVFHKLVAVDLLLHSWSGH